MNSYLPSSKKEALELIKKAEVAVAGRSKFEDRSTDDHLSMVALSIGLLSFFVSLEGSMSMALGGEVTSSDRLIFSIFTSFFISLAIWTLSLVVLKQTILRSTSAALLGIISAFLSAFLVEMVLEILLLEMRWDIVWSNRALLAIGPDLTLAMTSDLIPAHNWRFWPFIFISMLILGASYGTSETKTRTFAISFILISFAFISSSFAFPVASTLSNVLFPLFFFCQFE